MFKTITNKTTGTTKITNSLFEQIKEINSLGFQDYMKKTEIDIDSVMNDYVKIIGLKFDALEGLTVVQVANRKDLVTIAEFTQTMMTQKTYGL